MATEAGVNPYLHTDRAMSNSEKLDALRYALERKNWAMLPSIGGVGCPNCLHGMVPELGRGMWEWHILCDAHRAAGTPYPHMEPTCRQTH